ncbi:Saccharopine dehydrogenase [Sporodiniella umbellata]|nr:Saccharopine dehydrogenase [Sporodiniella umbellata]
MNNKQFDITVFGATGLTGKHIVRHIFELSEEKADAFPSGFRWAIAGRDQNKLQDIVTEMNERYPKNTVATPSVLVASVTEREKLDSVTSQTRVLINAVGPFRFLGEYVVRSCVDQGCHYVDVSGEPEFVERMQRTYQTKAAENRVTIVHSCGFDSVPTDMGVLYTKNLYKEKGWVPSQIEMFFKLNIGEAGMRGGYATYESAVHGFGSADLLREIRKASTLKKLEAPIGPRLKLYKGATKDKEYGYRVPFIFADPSIVRLSQQLFLTGMANTEENRAIPPTVQFAGYVLFPSFWAIAIFTIYGFIFSFLAGSHWGRQLLLKHPELFSAGIFSKEHPTQTQLDQSSFEIVLRSKGYDTLANAGPTVQPNRSLKVVVKGPEPGYIATPRLVLQSALVLLDSRHPIARGVLTPSTAFWQTDLIQRLGHVGISFDSSNE